MATYTQVATNAMQAYLEDAIIAAGGAKSDAATEAARGRKHTFVTFALLAAEAMASTASDKLLLVTTGAIKITAVKVLPDAALTADPSNYATVSLKWDDDAGGSDTSLASITTATGSWTSGVSVPLTLATDTSVASGKALRFITAKTGSGVAVPVCKIQVEYQDV